MKKYRARIADDNLKRKLEGKGAVLIEGPKRFIYGRSGAQAAKYYYV